MATNLLVLLHGMNPIPEPMSQDATYDRFWRALTADRPELERRMQLVKVEWGHEVPGERAPVRDDHQLTLAEQFVLDRVGRENVEKVRDPNNETRMDIGIPGMHWAVGKLRESIVLFGLGDVVYYCSADGEARVRQQVFEQVLDRLDAHAGKTDVRLHVFAHSLGVAIAHDFLFGLFNTDPEYVPGFVKDRQGSQDDARRRFMRWREKAQAGEITLGGFACAASQLPMLLLRSQRVVTTLYEAKRQANAGRPAVGIDPTNIGIRSTDAVQWKIFYDADDLLGYPSRGLYTLPDGRPHPAIMDVQVDCGAQPLSAHVGYWTERTVIHESAKLFAAWLDVD